MSVHDMHDKNAEEFRGHGGHHWMMVACCIPMLVIAVVLVATGVASAGVIFIALMCFGMMWLMMRGMSGGDDAHRMHR